jgi:SAM-dependent methyltransferase
MVEHHAPTADGAPQHWEGVWTRLAPDAVSWYQATAEPCATVVRGLVGPADHIAVMGAGTSALVVELARGGFTNIEAVDIAPAALSQLSAALGENAGVTFRQADVRTVEFEEPLDLWHDRATFHFLTDPADQARYAQRATQAIRPGGHLVMATFAPDGPEMCSGLPVRRHSAETLSEVFAPHFELVDSFDRVHHTPNQASQAFLHAVLRRDAEML